MASADDILRAREERAERQRRLLRSSRSTVISFTLNIPGPEKQSPLYIRLHQEGLAALLAVLPVTESRVSHRPTGSEALLASPLEAGPAKILTATLERNHPLGRIFDLDVLNRDGSAVSGAEMGFPPRTCFVCSDEAAVCARSRRHPLAELLPAIERLAGAYFL